MLTIANVLGRSRDGLYEPALADSEREAVADLLGYLENVGDGRCYKCASTNGDVREEKQIFSRASLYAH